MAALDYERLSTFIQRVGFPAVVTLILLFGLLPRIDHGIEVADRVDGKLTVFINACGGPH